MTAEAILFIIEGVVALLVLLQTVYLIRGGVRSMTVVFFLFAMIAMLINNAYWIAYSVILPDVRMPFSADDVGEAALFLLLASALLTSVPKNNVPFTKQTIGTIAFAAASVALWIGWSGEWVQDIVGGVVFCYFLCSVARVLTQTGALSRKEWILLGAGAAVVIAGWAAQFHLPDSMYEPVGLFTYIVMFVLLVWILVKAFLAVRKKESPKVCVALSFAAYAWVVSTIYMSAGIWYLAATAACCVSLVLMSAAVRAEVAAL